MTTTILLYDQEVCDYEAGDTPGAVAYTTHDAASLEATRRALHQRYGVDLGPLLGTPRLSWSRRLARWLGGRPSSQPSLAT